MAMTADEALAEARRLTDEALNDHRDQSSDQSVRAIAGLTHALVGVARAIQEAAAQRSGEAHD